MKLHSRNLCLPTEKNPLFSRKMFTHYDRARRWLAEVLPKIVLGSNFLIHEKEKLGTYYQSELKFIPIIQINITRPPCKASIPSEVH